MSLEKLAQNWLKIVWNKKLIFQMKYDDKNLFYNFFLFIIEKFGEPWKRLGS